MLEYCTPNSTHWIVFEVFQYYILSWMLLAFNISAIIGSSLCVCVIVKYNVFSVNTKCWFLALIISDIIIIFFAANDFYFTLIFEDRYQETLLGYSHFLGCQARFGLVVAISWVCTALQTGLSLERTIHVITPIKARVFFTVKKSKIIIILLVLVSGVSGLVISFCTLEVTITSANTTSCERKTLTLTKFVYFVDLIIFRGLTFGIMTITTVILVIFIKRRRNCRKFTLQRSTRPQSGKPEICKANPERRMFILLIVMNVITLLTNPLFLLFELIDGESSEKMAFAKLTGDKCLSSILSKSFNELMYVNNLTNWIFYINVGSKFRSHLKMFINSPFDKKRLNPATYENSLEGQGLTAWYQKSIKNNTSMSIQLEE